jgi:hypothetical protein
MGALRHPCPIFMSSFPPWRAIDPRVIELRGGSRYPTHTMAKPIISADSHITEPPTTYVDRIDAKFRDPRAARRA